MPAPVPRLAAVILAGGTGERLGGADKAALEVGGHSLLEHALAATASAEQVAVVGPARATSRPVSWAREDPPGGGPAAGILAGLDALPGRADLVCVLAVDLPRFSAATLDRLIDVLLATSGADAACLVDASGHMQWLAGVYRYDALLAARPADTGQEYGLSTRRLLRPLRIAGVPVVGDEARDVDTWEDLRDLRD